MLNPSDTIVGVASPPGGGLRGIVRVSGPQSLATLDACFTSSAGRLSDVRRAVVLPGTIRLERPWRTLPGELYAWPDARSYTHEPAAEFHTCGSPPLLDAVVRAVCHAGGRVADRGEFTLRAFLAGRIDLTQAEAVLGVIDAQTPHGLDAALAQLAGGLSRPLQRLRGELVDLLAELEAGLDFVEEDIQFIEPAELHRRLQEVVTEINRITKQLQSRAQSNDEPTAVLYGWPNVGKSSLFNALVGDRAAIVSGQAGTTRDYLTRRISCDGQTVRLVDTAGKEVVTADLGQAQTLADEQTRRASLRLLCLDGTRPLNPWEHDQLAAADASLLVVVTKADVGAPCWDGPRFVLTSAECGTGLDDLRVAISRRLDESREAQNASTVPATAVRCGESLRLAADAVTRAGEVTAAGLGEELAAAELRVALNELSRVVGTVYTDDILDRIFSRFCIGK